MVDPAAEAKVTYPRFLTDPGGRLLFSYRDGSSGLGSTYYNGYDPATATWSRYFSTPLIDGGGTRSPYGTTPALGPDILRSTFRAGNGPANGYPPS